MFLLYHRLLQLVGRHDKFAGVLVEEYFDVSIDLWFLLKSQAVDQFELVRFLTGPIRLYARLGHQKADLAVVFLPSFFIALLVAFLDQFHLLWLCVTENTSFNRI